MRNLWLLCLGLALAGCAYSQAAAPYQPPGGQEITDGTVLYARQCAWCHGSDGRGTARGPDLDGALDGGAYTDFMLTSGRMPLSSPASRAFRGPTSLQPDQIAALVAIVESFGGDGPPVPQPDPSAGHLSTGAHLYLTNCSACHSATGIGGALASGRVAPDLTNPAIGPIQIAEAMLVGPGCRNNDPQCGPGSGAMPRFDFDPGEVDDIVAYVGYLQHHGNTGGWSLGRTGPVTEGAVAWLLGLGAMVAAGRWIGTRSGDSE